MDTITLKQNFPTFVSYWEKRQKARRNRLPKHLRPPTLWPVLLQMALNGGIAITLLTILLNKDDYVTDAAPAIGMVICTLLLIYTVISGIQLRNRYADNKGERLALINLWLLGGAFLCLPAVIIAYLP